MKRTLLLLSYLFGCNFVEAQVCSPPSSRVWVSIRDANGVGDTIWFGVDGTATRGIDSWLCETEYPPPPPVGVFDVRFVGWGIFPFGQGLKQDYRRLTHDALRDTHVVRFQTSESSLAYPVTLHWSAAQIAAVWDSVILTDNFWNGWLFWVNMTLLDSLVIQNPAHPGVTLWTRRHSVMDADIDMQPPTEFSLYQNYPNPFNPSTSISFSVGTYGPASPAGGHTSLRVFNLLGQEVATLVNEKREAGEHTVSFDATGLPSGVYFYRLEAGEFVQKRKMVLMK